MSAPPDPPIGVEALAPRPERAHAWQRIPVGREIRQRGLALRNEQIAAYQCGPTCVVSMLNWGMRGGDAEPMWFHSLSVTCRGDRPQAKHIERALADFAVDGETWVEARMEPWTRPRVFVFQPQEPQ